MPRLIATNSQLIRTGVVFVIVVVVVCVNRFRLLSKLSLDTISSDAFISIDSRLVVEATLVVVVVGFVSSTG